MAGTFASPATPEEWHAVLHSRVQSAIESAGARIFANASRLTEDLATVVAQLAAQAASPASGDSRARGAVLYEVDGSAAASAAHDEDDEGCSGLDGVWSPGLHVMAIFVVLIASTVGILFPLVGKWVPALRLSDYVYAVGKAIAIGVMLGVSLIHMLAESAEQMEAPCIPAHFSDLYGSWPFAFAMAAFVLMHALDATVQDVATSWALRNEQNRTMAAREPGEVPHEDTTEAQQCVDELMAGHTAAATTTTAVVIPAAPAGTSEPICPSCTHSVDPAHKTKDHGKPTDDHASCSTCSSPASPGLPEDAREFCLVHGEEERPCTASRMLREAARKDCEANLAHASHDHNDGEAGHPHTHEAEAGGHGHSHGYVAAPSTMPAAQRVVAAIALEFGVTLHSVIIGLTMGITTDTELRTLIIALCFHQLFEGVAMGSRLADASFHRGVELALAGLFVVSAPLGTAVGTAVVSGSRSALSGTSFVLTCAVFNAVCSGILLYLTATLLLYDFAADLRLHAGYGMPHRLLKRTLLFAAFWIGAGVMALIGKWL